jgi:hypothetical protein
MVNPPTKSLVHLADNGIIRTGHFATTGAQAGATGTPN